MHENCLGCQISTGELTPPGGIVYRDPFWIINHAIGNPKPMMRGLFIIQPIQHFEAIADIPAEQMSQLGLLVHRVTTFLRDELNPTKTYMCCFGEGVSHIHFLVLPRISQMPSSGRQVLQEVIEEGLWTCELEEAMTLSAKLKAYLD